MCHDVRRNSPSVAACSPTRSCMATTSRIAASSAARSAATSISPAACAARAASRRAGRSRLPTWSARNGGSVRTIEDGDAGRLTSAWQDPVRWWAADRALVHPGLDGMDDAAAHRHHRTRRGGAPPGTWPTPDATQRRRARPPRRPGRRARPHVGPPAPPRGPAPGRAGPRRGAGARGNGGRGVPAIRRRRHRRSRPSRRNCSSPRSPELVAARPGRVRLAVDGPPPTNPRALADAVAVELRARGRATIVVDAGGLPASRRRYGWSSGARTRTCSSTAGSTSAACAARCSNPRRRADRAGCCPGCGTPTRTGPTATPTSRCPRTAWSCSPAALLLGRGLPLDVAVHLRMTDDGPGPSAAGRQRWTLPAYARYAAENTPEENADLLVLADHPDRPRCDAEVKEVGEEGVEPSRPYGHTDLNRARLPFRHSPWRSES